MCVHRSRLLFSSRLLESRRGLFGCYASSSASSLFSLCFWLPAGKKVVSFLLFRRRLLLLLCFAPLPTAFRALLYSVLLYFVVLVSLSLSQPLSFCLTLSLIIHWTTTPCPMPVPFLFPTIALFQPNRRFARTTLRTIPNRLKRKTNKNELNRKA